MIRILSENHWNMNLRIDSKTIIKVSLRLIGLLILVYILSKINIRILFESLIGVNLFLLSFAILLRVPIFYLSSIQLKIFLKNYGIDEVISNLFKYNVIARFFSVITPGQLGDFIKILFIKKPERKYFDIFQAVLFDRLVYILVVIAFGLLSVLLISDLTGLMIIIIIISALIIIIFFASIFAKKLIDLLNNFIIKVGKRRFGRFIKGNRVKFISIDRVGKGIVISTINFFLTYLRFYIIALSLDIKVPFITLFIAFSLVSLTSYLPFSIAGMGTKEAVLVLVFNSIGEAPEKAISLSILVLFVWLIIALVGFVLYQTNQLDIRKLKGNISNSNNLNNDNNNL